MKKLIALSASLLLGMYICFAAEPKITSIDLTKNEFKPGETLSVSIEFSGKLSDIQSVELFSREYRYDAPKMLMQPKGDGKNIWVLQGDIPYDAPYGTYNIEIKALNKKGEEIVSPDCENCTYGKTGVFKFVLK